MDKLSKTPNDYAHQATKNKDQLLALFTPITDVSERAVAKTDFHPNIEATVRRIAIDESSEKYVAEQSRSTVLDLYDLSRRRPELLQGTRKSTSLGFR